MNVLLIVIGVTAMTALLNISFHLKRIADVVVKSAESSTPKGAEK